MSILADHEIAALCAPDFVCRLIASRRDTGERICTFVDYAMHDHIEEVHARLMRKAVEQFITINKAPQDSENLKVLIWNPISIGGNNIVFHTEAEEFEFSEEAKTFKPMIEGFVPHQVRARTVVNPEQPDDRHEQRILSYGLSGHGYDVTLAREFCIFTNVNSAVIDPLDFDEEACLVKHQGDVCIVPPNSYVLGHTKEVFNIPEDIMVACLGKSTYARAGGIVNVTPIEAGFSGTVVIEVSNSTNLPLKIYADQGIAQFLFLRSDKPCDVSYAVGNRKYQGQRGIVVPKV